MHFAPANFTTAQRPCYFAGMRVYMFFSSTNKHLTAFTDIPSPRRLPPELGPWRTANAGASIYINERIDARMAGPIKTQGYFLATDKPCGQT